MENKRNLKVEFLRIISILLVIANHSVLNLYYGNPYKYLAVEAITLMGVTIFFIITGFYLYNNNNSIIKVYRNYLFKVFIPFSIFCIAVISFEKAITCEQNIVSVIKNIDLITVVKTYLVGLKYWTCTKWTYLLGHTWYIFDYSIIIILFPATYYIVNKLDKRFLYALCFLFLIFIIFVDFSVPDNLEIYAMSKNIPKVVFLSLCSYIFYNVLYKFFINKLNSLKERIILKKLIFLFIFILLFIVLLYLMINVQLYYDSINTEIHFPYYFRQESFLMIVISFIFIIIYLLFIDIVENRYFNNITIIQKEKISQIILFFSKKTFLVYLIHSELIVITMNIGLFKYFANDNAIIQAILNIIYIFLIYFLSIIVVYLIDKIILFIKKLIN